MEGNTYDEKYNVLSRTGTFHYVIFQLIVHEQDTAGPLRFQFCCLCLDKFPSVDILSLYRHSGVTGTWAHVLQDLRIRTPSEFLA